MEGGGGELAYIRLVMGAQASVSPGLCPDTQGPPRVPEGQHGAYCHLPRHPHHHHHRELLQPATATARLGKATLSQSVSRRTRLRYVTLQLLRCYIAPSPPSPPASHLHGVCIKAVR